MNTKAKERSSNIELMRILAMLMIIMGHYVVHSDLIACINDTPPMSFHALFVSIEGMWGKTAINCFVMITGYFMCTSHITIRKFLKLLLEIEFYNVALMLIFMATGYEFFSFKGILHHINPITSVFDLFVSCYLLFFLFIPFLNILIHNMNRKQHGALVMLLLFIYTFLGTIPYITVKYNYVSWFIVIYL